MFASLVLGGVFLNPLKRGPAPAGLASSRSRLSTPFLRWPVSNAAEISRELEFGLTPLAWVPGTMSGAPLRRSLPPTPCIQVSQPKRSHLRVIFSGQTKGPAAQAGGLRLLPFLELYTPLLLAAVGLDPALRYASIAQTITAQASRRTLITLGRVSWSLFCQGLVPGLKNWWRRVNSPLGEIYAHPLTEAVVADVKVAAPRAYLLEAQVNGLVRNATNLDPEKPELSSAALEELYPFFLAPLLGGARPRSLRRYAFLWAQFLTDPRTPHCYVKTRRARSIKKRLSKRLTSLAQRRFWVV